MKRLAVFCGASTGTSEVYKEGAAELGKELAKRGITLVYGGSNAGIMGAVANAVLDEGGEAIGVIPRLLMEQETAHPHLTELHTVNTMHERKAKMAELADGFITMPGGPGTMEEFFEIFTWSKIGLHQKPCGLLNTNNYYQPLLTLFDHMVEQGFLQEKHRSLVLLDDNAQGLIDKFHTYEPPALKTPAP